MLLIFDCDGVLVDSEAIACVVDAEYFAELGIPLTANDVADLFVGASLKDMIAALTRDYGALVPTDFAEESKRRVMARFETDLVAIDGVAAAIQSLPYRRCVASSSRPERISRSLALTGLADFFGDRLFSSSMVARGKPAPDVFLHAAQEMGVAPRDCIVIEDSVLGATGAVAAGMRVIGFVGGTHVRDKAAHAVKLKNVGAHAVIGHMRDLRETIEAFFGATGRT